MNTKIPSVVTMTKAMGILYENHRFFDWYTNRMGGSSLYFDIIKDYGDVLWFLFHGEYHTSRNFYHF